MALLEALNTDTPCAILTNKDGEVLVLHEKDLRLEVEYAEYDPQTRAIAFVLASGELKPLGIELDDAIENNIKLADSLTLALFHGSEIRSRTQIPLFRQH